TNSSVWLIFGSNSGSSGRGASLKTTRTVVFSAVGLSGRIQMKWARAGSANSSSASREAHQVFMAGSSTKERAKIPCSRDAAADRDPRFVYPARRRRGRLAPSPAASGLNETAPARRGYTKAEGASLRQRQLEVQLARLGRLVDLGVG